MTELQKTMIRQYFDYNASAPLLPSAYEAMCRHLQLVGNASSPHAFGRIARRGLDEARAIFADYLGVPPRHVIFTASATEANNLALLGCSVSHYAVSAVEHESVWHVAEALQKQGKSVSVISVKSDGSLCENELEDFLEMASNKNFLVSLMAANNETGVLWDVEHYARIIHDKGGWLHCDAVQSLGRLPVSAFAAADMVSLSSHKIGGAVGAGACVVLSSDAQLLSCLQPFYYGGGQEYGLRAGTENVAAVASFAAALGHCEESLQQQAFLQSIRDQFEQELEDFFGARIIFWGREGARLAGTSCFSIKDWRSEEMLMALDLEGFAVSSGSACSSGQMKPSRIIAAMGGTDSQASETVRVSFGCEHLEKDALRLALAVKRLSPLASVTSVAI